MFWGALASMAGRKWVSIGHRVCVLYVTMLFLTLTWRATSFLILLCPPDQWDLNSGASVWPGGTSNLDLGYLSANTFTSHSTKRTLLRHTFTGGIESGCTGQVFSISLRFLRYERGTTTVTLSETTVWVMMRVKTTVRSVPMTVRAGCCLQARGRACLQPLASDPQDSRCSQRCCYSYFMAEEAGA